MDARVKALVKEFENNGWLLAGSPDVSNDWWFQEIIQLVSFWKPVGKYLYLTILTDPGMIKNKAVWAVGIPSSIPPDNHFIYIEQITLNDIKKTDIKLLVQRINKIILK